MKRLAVWDPNDKKVAKYVDEALNAMEDNGSLTGSNIWRFDRYVRLLAPRIDMKSVDETHERVPLIHQAIVATKRESADQPALDRVREHLDRLVGERQQRPVKRYRILYPLNLRRGQVQAFRSIRVLGLTVRRKDWGDLPRKLKLREWTSRADDIVGHEKGVRLLSFSFVPLEVMIDAQSAEEAWAKSIRSLELLRAVLNTQDTWGSVSMQAGQPQPLGGLRPAPIFGVFESDGSEASWYRTIAGPGYSSSSPRDRDWRRTRRVIRTLNGVQSEEIQRLLADALIKYGEALETVEWRHGFLSLWQVLELLTLQSAAQMNMREIGNRIALLLGGREDDRDLLAALATTRNDLVHTGRYPDSYGLDEMQLLKSVVERSINALLAWYPKLESRLALRLLYESLGVPNTELRLRARAITMVRGWRKKQGKR